MGKRRLHWISITGLMVGSIVGAGIFDFPRQFSQSSVFFALFVAWVLTGLGVVALSIVFQKLAQGDQNRAEPQWSDIQGQLKQQYGLFFASLAAWGYWCSAWVGNLAYLRMVTENLLQSFGLEASHHFWLQVFLSSALLWMIFCLLRQGLQSFSQWNLFLTALKFLSLAFMAGSLVYHFSGEFFLENCISSPLEYNQRPLLAQVKSAMLYTAWLFLGFEGSVLVGHHAKDAEAVKKAMWTGLTIVFGLYLGFSVAVYGSLPLKELRQLPQSASLSALTANFLGEAAGAWLRSIIVLFALGALLPWTLYAGTLPQQAALQGLMPEWLKESRADGLPYLGILASVLLTQGLLLISYFWHFNYDHLVAAATLSVVPSYFSASWLIVRSQKDISRRIKACGWIGVLYSVWLLYGLEWCVYVQLALLLAIGAVGLFSRQYFYPEIGEKIKV